MPRRLSYGTSLESFRAGGTDGGGEGTASGCAPSGAQAYPAGVWSPLNLL